MIPRTRVNYSFFDVLVAGWFGLLRRDSTASLKERLAALFGNDQLILTGSGRGALYILLKALPQKNILVPAYTCKAVVESATLAGKNIYFAECSTDTFNIDYAKLPHNIGPDWLILATHQYGFCSDIFRLIEFGKSRGAAIIEDVAAAFGSKTNGSLAGTFGDAAFFSFDSTKLINAPLKAGFLIVKDQAVFNKCLDVYESETRSMPLFRQIIYLILGIILTVLSQPLLYRVFHYFNFVKRRKFTADTPELNRTKTPFYIDRTTNWQAWLVDKQLANLDFIYSERRRIYQEFMEGLRECRNIKLPPNLNDHDWIPIRFPVIVPRDKLSFYRKACEAGVDFAFSFSFIGAPKTFAESHKIADGVLNLPFYLHLSPSEVRKVIEVIRKLDRIVYAS